MGMGYGFDLPLSDAANWKDRLCIESLSLCLLLPCCLLCCLLWRGLRSAVRSAGFGCSVRPGKQTGLLCSQRQCWAFASCVYSLV